MVSLMESGDGAARIVENLREFGLSPIGFSDFAAWFDLWWSEAEAEADSEAEAEG